LGIDHERGTGISRETETERDRERERERDRERDLQQGQAGRAAGQVGQGLWRITSEE
jgi:hypothetical protein